ncbi:hypothetical protein BGW36DRAFT_402388 [Talaromyces proteolyticus]|uniref:Uncharacterized protein n=1 Tax=Talaromyces proteolyticus TaxID=1131652 RepID=A0AAD4KCW3_9EURO|nr:uncharacterized protein BGW36DRAFT_402388 [Talaromyces proteolyticus]KAH8688898.1 hypothetical protein BGW36DRAFT_402388 [Talaromyces proteolyticus]
MGQAQSSKTNQSDGEAGNEAEHRTDYYKLLNLERDASEEEIKKAYRRKALELHPDRNYGSVEAATKLFAEVQCAYEVLSDPQERAWYDSHRDAVFSDDTLNDDERTPGGFRMTTADILALVFNFNPRMEFSDSPKGFFGGLRDVFDQIAREEELSCRWENLDIMAYPSFGCKDDTDGDIVRSFYAVWANFATRKSFVWKDVYKYSEAPDRRVRRLMEKENKKIRDDAIREYNDAVRSLVAFVRKRDPRYKSNTQSEAERQRMLRESAAAQAARSRAANQARMQEYTIPDWAKMEEIQDDLSSSSESEVEHFECIVCNKTFKSEKQFEAHERSKKHAKAVKQLRTEMMVQDEELELFEDLKLEEIPEKPPRSDLGSPSTAKPASVTEEHEATELDSSHTNNTLPGPDSGSSPSASEDDDDYTAREEIQSRIFANSSNREESEIITPEELIPLSSGNEMNTTIPTKLGKAKQKRAKRAAAAQASGSQHICGFCREQFPSRTQLFTHIREEGHAQPVQQAQSRQKAKKM